MKKFTLILATVALLAAGCTKTEVVGPQNRKGINFAAYTAKTTKAPQIDVERGNLTKFEVTAFGNGALYFDNVTFEKHTTNNITVWESDTKYFWPAFALTFCAYNTPSGYATQVQPTGFGRTINTTTQTLEVTPAPQLADQEDLVAAYAAGMTEINATNAGNTALPLTFNHYLTQVIVQAKNARTDIYQVVVKSVKIANMAGEGTYTFSTNTMTAPEETVNSENSIDYTATFTRAKTLGSDAQEVMTEAGTGKWYLIPQSVTSWDPKTDRTNTNHGTYLALKVKITTNKDNEAEALKIYPATSDKSGNYKSGWMAVPIPSGLKFEQGKKYTVNINFFANNGAGYVDPEAGSDLNGDGIANDNGKKIIGGEIKFDANVNERDDQNNNIEIYL